MNKTTITLLASALLGGMIFAGGASETSSDQNRPGLYGMAEIEIITVNGTITTDSYGNLMLEDKDTNYLLSKTPTLDVELIEGDILEGEGVAGRTLYTKDDKTYTEFHLTLVTQNGVTSTIDMDQFQSGTARGRGGMSNREGMSGRGGMDHDDFSDHDDRFDRNRDDRFDNDHGGRMGSDDWNSEEMTLSGTITMYKEEYPMISMDGKNYVIMMGRDHFEDFNLSEGMSFEAEGFTGRSLYTTEGEDYYTFMITSAVIDGEKYELDHDARSNMMGGRSSWGRK